MRSNRPFSAPNFNTSGTDIPPKIIAITSATKAINSNSNISYELNPTSFMIMPPTYPKISPNREPRLEKINNVTNFANTISFFVIGNIRAYLSQCELSSNVKVVIIIILHKIAQIKI